MLRAEINESGTVFINRYVLTAFLVEQGSIDTIEYALVETVCPVTAIHQQQLSFMGMPRSRGFCRTRIVNPFGSKHAGYISFSALLRRLISWPCARWYNCMS